jgi:hypothetical protein
MNQSHETEPRRTDCQSDRELADRLAIRPISRRELLRHGGMGFGSLALAGILGREGMAAPPAAVGDISAPHPLAKRKPHFDAKAKSVIWLFLNGGPSHVDTWDYKPELQKRDGQLLAGADPKTGFFTTSGKLLKSPFSFKQHGESGAWVSEIFPNLAKHVDQMAFIHSCYTESNNHSPALFQLNTGLNRMGFPCVGSWITYGLGSENEDMPGFVVMTDALGRGLPKGKALNWGAGFLPGVYQATPLNNQTPAIDNLLRRSDQSATQQRRMMDLVQKSNREHQQRYADEADLTARIDALELAFRMQMSAPGVLDVDQETEATRKSYGLDDKKCAHFGRQCLLARRMVEQGVRFIQIYSGGTGDAESWDGHKDIRKNHSTLAGEVDQPIAALLADLKERGLLESTLVICGGEFGRTSDAQDSQGRDHNPNAFTTWFAGGGIKGGVHHGATDDVGYKAIENRTSVHDLHATILHLLGMDHKRLTYRFNGRDYRLTDVYGDVVTEIIA